MKETNKKSYFVGLAIIVFLFIAPFISVGIIKKSLCYKADLAVKGVRHVFEKEFPGRLDVPVKTEMLSSELKNFKDVLEHNSDEFVTEIINTFIVNEKVLMEVLDFCSKNVDSANGMTINQFLDQILLFFNKAIKIILITVRCIIFIVFLIALIIWAVCYFSSDNKSENAGIVFGSGAEDVQKGME